MNRRSVLLIAAVVPVAGLLPSASAASLPPDEAAVLLAQCGFTAAKRR